MSTKEEAAVETAKTESNGKQDEPKGKNATEVVDLTEVQVDKIKKLLVTENQLNAELQKIRGQKNDFFELVLDANGWEPEKMGKVIRVEFNEQNQILLTLAP